MLESEIQQKYEGTNEAGERKREMNDIKALIQKQKQLQDQSTAELGLLRMIANYALI